MQLDRRLSRYGLHMTMVPQVQHGPRAVQFAVLWLTTTILEGWAGDRGDSQSSLACQCGPPRRWTRPAATPRHDICLFEDYSTSVLPFHSSTCPVACGGPLRPRRHLHCPPYTERLQSNDCLSMSRMRRRSFPASPQRRDALSKCAADHQPPLNLELLGY